MAKVVAFMDEGRSHGNDLTAALLPPATAAPAQDSAPQLSPQQLPAPSHRQDPPPPPQMSDVLPEEWLPPPDPLPPQANGSSPVASLGPSPHPSRSFSNRSARRSLDTSRHSADHPHSLHGEKAARRQATMELLFFASIGDASRCETICELWDIDVRDRGCCDYDKRTPLHLAAAEGCYSVVQWLVEDMGADPNPVDRFGRTPLEDAVRGDHAEVVQLLMQLGGKVRATSGALVDLQTTPLSRFAAGVGPEDAVDDWRHEWEIDPATLEIGPKVGEGEFGTVHKAKWHGATVAVKILRRSDEVGLGDFRTELNVLQKVHHPHAVRFFGACTKRQPYMIVTEFLPGGSLADVFAKRNTAGAYMPDMRRAVGIALDTCKGMAYLHRHGKHMIVHRDLKPANLMLGGIPHETGTREMAAREGNVKIADFGLSRSLAITREANKRGSMTDLTSLAKREGSSQHHDRSSGEGGANNDSNSRSASRQRANRRYDLTGETGSYRYMAPEVFRHEPYNSKVDVYAFAMIAYELFEGKKPFGNINPIEAARRASMDRVRPEWGKWGNHWGAPVPPALREMVEECWAPDFEARPSFPALIKRLEEALKTLPATPPTAAGGRGAASPGKGCCAVQ